MNIHEFNKILLEFDMSKYIKKKDLNLGYKNVGKKYNKLTILCDTGYRTKNRKVVVLSVCECGNYCVSSMGDITHPKRPIKSCGCLKQKTYKSERIIKILRGMKYRCYDKNHISYDRYGGKGITVCDDWINDPFKFYQWSKDNGYFDNATIDRINNDKGYSPENCRWISKAEQNKNKTNNIKINGELLSVYLDRFKITSKTEISKIYDRIHKNWSFKEIFQEHYLNNFKLEKLFICKNLIQINDEKFDISEYCKKYGVSKNALLKRYSRLNVDVKVVKEYILNSK